MDPLDSSAIYHLDIQGLDHLGWNSYLVGHEIIEY